MWNDRIFNTAHIHIDELEKMRNPRICEILMLTIVIDMLLLYVSVSRNTISSASLLIIGVVAALALAITIHSNRVAHKKVETIKDYNFLVYSRLGYMHSDTVSRTCNRFKCLITNIYKRLPASNILLDKDVFINILEKDLAWIEARHGLSTVASRSLSKPVFKTVPIDIYTTIVYNQLVMEFMGAFSLAIYNEDVADCLGQKLSNAMLTISDKTEKNFNNIYKYGFNLVGWEDIVKTKEFIEKINAINADIAAVIEEYISLLDGAVLNNRMINVYFEKIEEVLCKNITEPTYKIVPSFLNIEFIPISRFNY